MRYFNWEKFWFLLISIFCFVVALCSFLINFFYHQTPYTFCETCSLNFLILFSIFFVFLGSLFLSLPLSPRLAYLFFEKITKSSNFIIFLFISILVLFSITAFFSEQAYMDDSYSYFLVAKSLWEHPEIMLERTATIVANKLLFIFMASPFAQFYLQLYLLFSFCCPLQVWLSPFLCCYFL